MLDHQLQMLAGGGRDLPARHRSLRAAIESSLDVITPAARTLVRQLGGFVGGGVLGDLEAVAATFGHDRDWLLTGLAELVDMYLVRVTNESATSRYLLPDTMTELAAEQLRSSSDRDAVERAVAVRLLERLRHGHDSSGPAVNDHDAANVRHTVGWALAHRIVDAEIVSSLSRFYETTGRLVEGEKILCRIAGAGHAIAWVRAGHLAALRGDLAAATEWGECGLRDAAAGDHVVRVTAVNLLAQRAIERGDPVTSRTRLRSALVEARRAGDLALIGRVLNNLSSASAEVGRPRDAERLLRAALQAKRRAGAGPVEIGRTLLTLAEIALELGEDEAAAARAGETVTVLRSGGFSRLAAVAESTVALAELRRGALPAALAAVDRSARLRRADEGDDRRTEAVALLRHSILVGAGDQLRRRPVSGPIQWQRDQAAQYVRRALGDAAYEKRLRHGAALDCALLLDLSGRIAAPAADATHPGRCRRLNGTVD